MKTNSLVCCLVVLLSCVGFISCGKGEVKGEVKNDPYKDVVVDFLNTRNKSEKINEISQILFPELKKNVLGAMNRQHKKIAPEEWNIKWNEIVEKYTPITEQKLLDATVAVYKEYFTIEELQQWNEFLKSDICQKHINEQEALQKEINDLEKELVSTLVENMLLDFKTNTDYYTTKSFWSNRKEYGKIKYKAYKNTDIMNIPYPITLFFNARASIMGINESNSDLFDKAKNVIKKQNLSSKMSGGKYGKKNTFYWQNLINQSWDTLKSNHSNEISRKQEEIKKICYVQTLHAR